MDGFSGLSLGIDFPRQMESTFKTVSSPGFETLISMALSCVLNHFFQKAAKRQGDIF